MFLIGYIYIIKNKINKKVYIGQTKKTIEKRWNEHKKNVENRNQIIYNAMRKYGIENFYIELLEQVDDSNLDSKEIYYIKKYNSLSPNGYNAVEGGSKFKNDNPMYHKEIAQKVSIHFVGDKNPAKRPEVKEKIRKKALGKKASIETRKKMSENNGRYWTGKHLSEETKRKISENHGCRGKFGGLNPNSKKVARVDILTDEILENYNSIAEAIIWVRQNIRQNASPTNISQACHGCQKTAFGFKWKFI